MSFVKLENVVKSYQMGDVAIKASDGIDFEIRKGELAVIVGPSGSGKTTILNMLGGMDTCDSGKIIVDGCDIAGYNDQLLIVISGCDIAGYNDKQLIEYRRFDIGFVFQFYNLIPNLTAKENVEMATQISRDSVPAEEMLARVGLGERLDNFPAQLSGGEQQRVAIARALAKKPKLLLCDEPTGALDYVTGKMILSLLEETCRKEGMTVVIVTHNAAIAPIADRVIKIKSSKVEDIITCEHPLSIEEIEW